MYKTNLATVGAVTHTHTHGHHLDKAFYNTCGKTSVTFVDKNNIEKMKTSFM